MTQDQSYCLADRSALQDVMLNYAAGVDDRDMKLYRSCFSDNAEVVGFGDKTFDRIDEWVDYVSNSLEQFSSTQHMLAPQLATIDAGGEGAQTRNDVQALHYFKSPKDKEIFMLWGVYKTDMEKKSGKWKIVRHELILRGTKEI